MCCPTPPTQRRPLRQHVAACRMADRFPPPPMKATKVGRVPDYYCQIRAADVACSGLQALDTRTDRSHATMHAHSTGWGQCAAHRLLGVMLLFWSCGTVMLQGLGAVCCTLHCSVAVCSVQKHLGLLLIALVLAPRCPHTIWSLLVARPVAFAGGDGCRKAPLGVAGLLCTPADPPEQVQAHARVHALGVPP